MSFGKFVNHLINADKSREEIYAALVNAGASPCVARDWSNEPKRREAAEAKRLSKKMNKSPITQKGAAYARIIQTKIWPEAGSKLAKAMLKAGLPSRERMLHATKGWREMRLQDMSQVEGSIYNYGGLVK